MAYPAAFPMARVTVAAPPMGGAVVLPRAVIGHAVPVAVIQGGGVVRTRSPVAPARYLVPAGSIAVAPTPAIRALSPVATGRQVLRAAPAVAVEPRSYAPHTAAMMRSEAKAPAPTAAGEAPVDAASSDQVLELLESLEARVDLMSQMQKTRAILQQRACALAAADAGGMSPAESGGWREDLPPGGWRDDGAGIYENEVGGQFQMPEELVPTQCGEPAWNQQADQEYCLSRLTGEVESLRQKVYSLEATTAMARIDVNSRRGVDPFANDADSYLPQPVATAPVASVAAIRYGNLDDTQYVPGIQGARAVGTTTSAGPLPTGGLDRAARPTAAGPLPRRMKAGELAVVAPFSAAACGANLELSADGYFANRTKGCRQAAAVGSRPLDRQEHGRYFEVVVEETVAGWVGGLGIGVTAMPPEQTRRIPDKAWRMPKTFVVGYWGCIFMDGVEHRTSWRPDTLNAGARVGVLVPDKPTDGDLIIFVDGTAVARVDGAQLATVDALYPVVDVFAATRGVSLCRQAAPPPPPWRTAPEGAVGCSTGSQPRSPSEASRTVSIHGGSQLSGAARAALL